MQGTESHNRNAFKATNKATARPQKQHCYNSISPARNAFSPSPKATDRHLWQVHFWRYMNTDLYRVNIDFWQPFLFPRTTSQQFSTSQDVSYPWGSISHFQRKVLPLLLLCRTIQGLLPDKHAKSGQYQHPCETLSQYLPHQLSQPWLSGTVVDVFHCHEKSMTPDNLSLYFWCHCALAMKWLHSLQSTAKACKQTAVDICTSVKRPRSPAFMGISLNASNNIITSPVPLVLINVVGRPKEPKRGESLHSFTEHQGLMGWVLIEQKSTYTLTNVCQIRKLNFPL